MALKLKRCIDMGVVKATICGVAIIAASLLLSFVIRNASADEPVSIGINVANKIDVALGIGPTNVDYSTFEADLRALLYAKDPAVLPEDLYITAAKAVSANSTSEFTWWVYDHNRPTATYGGSSVIDETEHSYMESPPWVTTTAAGSPTTASAAYISAAATAGIWGPQVANVTIVNTVGATNYVPGIGYQYCDKNPTNLNCQLNPDPTNPDLASYNTSSTVRLRHPYAGNNVHMLSTNSGSQMDFYGYPNYSYKDFRYLPNNQKTIKTFEFAIAEDAAYDALDGVGFFFNTHITDSGYNSNTQRMNGYLLYLQYYFSGTSALGGDGWVGSSDFKLGRGFKMALYKFEDVDTKIFHHTGVAAASTTGSGALSAAALDTALGSGGFTKIAENTTAYNAGIGTSASNTNPDFSRRIKIEAGPDKVKVWYEGSKTKNDASVLNIPIAESATPLNWTVQAAGALPADGNAPAQISGSSTQTVRLDTSIIEGYGFGPMASYVGHNCARPTHIALQNLTMTMDVVRELVEVVREPEWHDNTSKYLVNLNEEPIEDFSSTSITGELLNRLRNDDIYYIGWATDSNATASQDFLNLHNLKGLIVNMDDPATLTYEEQMQEIADKIYERYWRNNDDNVVLITDQVILSVSGGEKTESADLEWPDGKWRVVHRIDGDEGPIDNDEGIHPLSDKYLSDLDIVFDVPGYYDIYYRDHYLKTIIAHRAPIASFRVNINGGDPIYNNTSVDPDDEASGIVNSTWSYLDLDVDTTPNPGAPSTLIEGHTYLVILEVEDKYGETNSIAQQVRYLIDPEPEDISEPFSEFNITPSSILKNVTTPNIFLTNTSYDLLGLPISSTFTLTKDGSPYPYSFVEGNNDVSSLPAGNYSITLIVNNGTLDSVPFSRSFHIIEDLVKPTAAASTSTGSFSVNTPITLTFSDAGGSEFKEQRVAITTSSTPPGTSSTSWTMTSNNNTRTSTINIVGTSYIHWEAWDHAGNYNSGTFGPYALSKQATTVTLTTSPLASVVYPEPITLTATFDSMTSPTGTVYFQINGGTAVGSATITDGKAVFTYTPNGTYIGNVTISATYNGDSTYNPASDSLPFTIYKNTLATVTVGNQTDKTYDGDPFVPKDITVTETSKYKVEYKGRDGTTYDSTTPPVDAGKYTLLVTTTDPGYEEDSDSADFEIFKADQAPLIVTGLTSLYEFTPGATIALGTTGGSSGGTVTYISSNPTVASISAGTLTIHTTGDFTVIATMAGNANYNPVSSSAFSVSADDTTPPTGEVLVNGHRWTDFSTGVTFSIFHDTSAVVEITADDNSEETVTIEYYLSDRILSYAQALAITSWTAGDAFSITPNTKAIVYVKLTDTSGNITIINSTGVVVYSHSEQDTAAILHVKYTGHKNAQVKLNGNTVSNVLLDGLTTLTPGVDYTVNNSTDTITLLSDHLDSLSVGTYDLTINYNPIGETYVSVPTRAVINNIAPASTEISLEVVKTTPGMVLIAPPTELGDDLILTATVSKTGSSAINAPTGTVTFFIDGVATTESTDIALVNGVATFTIVGGLSEGSHILEAIYSGDDDYLTNDAYFAGFAMSEVGSLSTNIPGTGTAGNTMLDFVSSNSVILLGSVLGLSFIVIAARRRQRR